MSCQAAYLNHTYATVQNTEILITFDGPGKLDQIHRTRWYVFFSLGHIQTYILYVFYDFNLCVCVGHGLLEKMRL